MDQHKQREYISITVHNEQEIIFKRLMSYKKSLVGNNSLIYSIKVTTLHVVQYLLLIRECLFFKHVNYPIYTK